MSFCFFPKKGFGLFFLKIGLGLVFVLGLGLVFRFEFRFGKLILGGAVGTVGWVCRKPPVILLIRHLKHFDLICFISDKLLIA